MFDFTKFLRIKFPVDPGLKIKIRDSYLLV